MSVIEILGSNKSTRDKMQFVAKNVEGFRISSAYSPKTLFDFAYQVSQLNK